ncbi:hypothetical protein M501DRAFT_941321 [Patellaria atrata CBS 101060]|uniref:Helicase C-terminal domain-containing protein n=1 Tax=Patellaria atrata CBS 101060 TaxID=1346257 RepID=A0A9P4S3R0_9PEZI|nr:hypothetical protein M501DRAFT_941321 [Patellaria atrata CBS 101060]
MGDEIRQQSEPATFSNRFKKPRFLARHKNAKEIDTTLPPLFDISKMFDSITKNALDHGLRNVIKHLDGNPLKVATMCSGTESPLLALQMVQDSLKRTGIDNFHVEHVFSAELVEFKQAYIERNFHPERLFRDIREFSSVTLQDVDPLGSKKKKFEATTAYGSLIEVPSCDLLVVGPSCVDYSALNGKRKTIDQLGESRDTFHGVLNYARIRRPTIIIVENVSKAPWPQFQELFDEIEYESQAAKVDTKNFYLPQTRERGYMVCVDRRQMINRLSKLGQSWFTVFESFQRQASSPVTSFILPENDPRIQLAKKNSANRNDDSILKKESNWETCRGRHERFRVKNRLGFGRPITNWTDNGSLRPLEYADKTWLRKQTHRVHDFIEIAHLRKAGPETGIGYDTQYKTRIWDTTQNIDLFIDSGHFGIAGCITPRGSAYCSDRARPLTGYETLRLQGIPVDRITFTKESDEDIRDLAGNAMSSTVVGSAILSGLIVAYQGLSKHERQVVSSIMEQSRVQVRLLKDLKMKESTIMQDKRGINIEDLLNDARRSQQYCDCEGLNGVVDNIRICHDCGHTSCLKCAGNPVHNYRLASACFDRRIKPSEFEDRWKFLFPSRLEFQDVAGLDSLKSKSESKAGSDMWETFKGIYTTAMKQYFTLARFKRGRTWSIMYESDFAKLELLLSNMPEWRFFLIPPPDLPGESFLRNSLERFHIGKSPIKQGLLSGRWEWRVPSQIQEAISILGSGQKSPSWQNRLGLLHFKEQTVHSILTVKFTEKTFPYFEKMAGKYNYLPDCGTSRASLYRREPHDRENLDILPVYLRHDPDPIGNPEKDSFIFTTTCERDVDRPNSEILGRLSPNWLPEHVSERKTQVGLDWMWTSDVPQQTRLVSADVPIFSRMCQESRFSFLDSDCLSAKPIFECRFSVPEDTIPLHSPLLNPTLVSPDYQRIFGWAVNRIPKIPGLDVWHTFGSDNQSKCRMCAPQTPHIKWEIKEGSGNTKNLYPYEDAKEAVAFELALKSRPDVFKVDTSVDHNNVASIRVGVNVWSLVHRATSKLKTVNDIRLSWRLSSKYSAVDMPQLQPFRLASNTKDMPYDGHLSMKLPLRQSQMRSLTWMRQRESGNDAFLVEAVEEAVLPQLGWRAEARAQATIHVKGGVLADEVSYGKTVTILALMQAENDERSASSIRDSSRQLRLDTGLIHLPATLIVCPPDMVNQWPGEISKFLGYSSPEVLVIRTTADLKKLSINDFLQARIVVASWNVLTSEAYISQLSQLGAIPDPSTTKGRPFSTWLDYCLKTFPAHLELLQESGVQKFKSRMLDKYTKNIQNSEFHSKVPTLQRLRGKKYEEDRRKSGLSTVSKPRSNIYGWKDLAFPPLHCFHFNRLVVDEYTYLDRNHSDTIQSLKAEKRWVLSGTPELGDFADIRRTAALIGVDLGNDNDSLEYLSKSNVRAIQRQLTNAEKFLSYAEKKSSSWHEQRHALALRFLEMFVRQNLAETRNIKCVESFLPVNLTLGQLATYTELYHYLNPADMKFEKREENRLDRSRGIVRHLVNAITPEDALIRASNSNSSSCEAIQTKRKEELNGLQVELRRRILEAEKLKVICKALDTHYQEWKQSVVAHKLLGDDSAHRTMHSLIKMCQKDATRERGIVKLDAKKAAQQLRSLVSEKLRPMSQEFAKGTRSLRYIDSILKFRNLFATTGNTQSMTCDSEVCSKGKFKASEIGVLSPCGHIVCRFCFYKRTTDTKCVVSECNRGIEDHHFVSADLLLTADMKESDTSQGKKIDKVLELISSTPENDQIILFVQNYEIMRIIERSLDSREIKYHAIYDDSKSSTLVKDFQENEDKKKRKKVIVLNMADVSAAGHNLYKANHVIFFSPLLATTQQKYDASMTQAIGRARRYGQEKTVYIYRLATLNTVEVDILEQRERRRNALWQHKRSDFESTAKADIEDESAEKGPKAEKVRLVQDKKGRYGLVPRSYLEKSDHLAKFGVESVDELRTFSSLMSFSQHYTETALVDPMDLSE